MLSDVFVKLENQALTEPSDKLDESLRNLAQCYKCLMLVADMTTLDALLND